MAVTLRKYLNNQLKTKGLTVKQAQKNADKYKNIAAAKKAGSLYYTNKDGKVMAAIYAEDLKKPIKDVKPKKKPLRSSIKPAKRPSSVKRVTKALDKGSPNLKKTKKNKKTDPEAEALGMLTILQIQKRPGVKTIMEELEIKKGNLENRIAKAKKAGKKDLRAEASLRVIERRIKAFKERDR